MVCLACSVVCASFLGCDDASLPTLPNCGNNLCEEGETPTLCPQDCQDPQMPICGDGTCDASESSNTCPKDCPPEQDEPESTCGNGTCDADETATSCPTDCFCGNNSCDADESTEICPKDCPKKVRCGDGTCDAGETRLNCPQDCPPVCGDGLCEGGEYPDTCPSDCSGLIDNPPEIEAVCGDGICEDSEKETCPDDCNEAPSTLPTLTFDEFNNLTETPIRFLFDYSTALNAGNSSEDDSSAIEDFFAFPYPSETRTDEYGRPNLAGYPIPPMALLDLIGSALPSIKTIIPSLVTRVQTERAGFSPIAGVYFRTSSPIDASSIAAHYKSTEPEKTADADSCFQLINVEENSTHYGERVPVYVTYHRITDSLWAQNTLVMRPIPGVGPHPGDRHAAVVTNCLKSNGNYVNMSNKLRYILEEAAPEEITSGTSYYVKQLKKLEKEGKLGFQLSQIRAFTGYDTMNPATEMDQMAAALKGKGRLVADEHGVAIGVGGFNGWTSYINAYVFRGQFVTCNFIEGNYSASIPTYNQKGEGEIRFDADGKLVSTCKDETVFFEVTVPKTTMPDKGFPIAVYGHGTGGDARTHSRYINSEGLNLLDNGVPMAMVGFDACLQGNRTSGEGSETALYMMLLQNPVVVRESVRQTVNDMLVLYDLIDNGKFILPPRPNSKENTIFDPSYGLYMGHSQGSQEAGLLLGITDSVKNAFLSAGGGGTLISFIDLRPDLSGIQVIGTMLKGKSIADMLALLFNLTDGSISYDTFITNHIVQPLMDPVDPLNFTPRFVREPAPGMHPKNIAQTVGLGDQSTPTATQYAMIASIGLPFVGKVFESSIALDIAGLSQSVGNAVSENIKTANGKTTGAAIQYNYTGSDNPHFVIYNMASAKQAYYDFFKSVLEGKTTVSVTGSQEGTR